MVTLEGAAGSVLGYKMVPPGPVPTAFEAVTLTL
jgi:hypothetical protein